MNVKEASNLVIKAIHNEVNNGKWGEPRHLELNSTLIELDDLDDASAIDSISDQSKKTVESLIV